MTVVGGLLVALIIAFAPEFVTGPVDDFRDQLRGYEGERVDDLKEHIEDMSTWADEPEFLDESLSFLSNHPDLNVVAVAGLAPRYHTIGELVQGAVRFDGVPVFMVGRVHGKTTESDDSSAYYGRQFELRDASDAFPLFVGVAPFDDVAAHRGDVIVVRGLLLAVGDASYSNGRFPSGYFVGRSIQFPGRPVARHLSRIVEAFDGGTG